MKPNLIWRLHREQTKALVCSLFKMIVNPSTALHIKRIGGSRRPSSNGKDIGLLNLRYRFKSGEFCKFEEGICQSSQMKPGARASSATL